MLKKEDGSLGASKAWQIQFDHAAIATRDPEKLKTIFKILGLIDEGKEKVDTQGVITHFLKPEPSQPRIELLEPIDSGGTVRRYLDKKGPGIHHLSFRVSDLNQACEQLKANAIRLVYDKPQLGAHAAKVNFIHPESTGGILIEISEQHG